MAKKEGGRLIGCLEEYGMLMLSLLLKGRAGRRLVPYGVWKGLGRLSCAVLILMIASGAFLAIHYVPSPEYAFESVQHIMQDVRGGALFRGLHMKGASLFFIAVYLHLFRGLYTRSYKKFGSVWIFGVVIFLLMLATAFTGYVISWGQMSFWGGTVFINLFSSIPWVGEKIALWLSGGKGVYTPAVDRFFILHILLPVFLMVGVFFHLVSLQRRQSLDSLRQKKGPKILNSDDRGGRGLKFFRWGIMALLGVFLLHLLPNFFAGEGNSIPANSLVTPPHVMPEWYFRPFYGILCSIPHKLGGILAMFGSVFVLFLLPWLDRGACNSVRPKVLFRIFWAGILMDYVFLGWIGSKPVGEIDLIWGQVATLYYFFYFLVGLPLMSFFEKKNTSSIEVEKNSSKIINR